MEQPRVLDSKRKRHFAWPFSLQWRHERELKRQGKVYRYGSFKFTASELFAKRVSIDELSRPCVLVDLVGVSRSQRSDVTITISSDEPGVLEFHGSFLGVSVDPMIARVDDLLQKYRNDVFVITLFGAAKVNIAALINLCDDLGLVDLLGHDCSA